MRVLLDSGIFIHSAFAEPDARPVSVRVGDRLFSVEVHGLRKKTPNSNAELQKQSEALFTVGRLIREGRVRAYTYNELLAEGRRGGTPVREFYALRDCKIERCDSPLERSKFCSTTNIADWFAKGGKKDRKNKVQLGGANQIAFLQFACDLRPEYVELLIQHAQQLRLTAFEIDSLRNIDWFRFLCRSSGSQECYPDVFHLWTAERNGFDAFLTLDGSFQRFVSGIRRQKRKTIDIRADVLQPLELLKMLGIDRLDPVPIEDRFYHWHEVWD